MSTTRYTQEHEWLRIESDGLVTVGITDFAQGHLGDLVYVQLPAVGAELGKGEEAAVIESVKTAGEIMMPTAGTIVEVNTLLTDEPGKVNEEPLAGGWFFKMKIQNADELNALMDEAAYTAYVADLD
ncbi:MAG TPA: glycine cleavage system protein GcvH [Burkholderiaceae bacterium]|nr:glycine cleavage system protein GcvH [Burkholderiaceae bacterium]